MMPDMLIVARLLVNMLYLNVSHPVPPSCVASDDVTKMKGVVFQSMTDNCQVVHIVSPYAAGKILLSEA